LLQCVVKGHDPVRRKVDVEESCVSRKTFIDQNKTREKKLIARCTLALRRMKIRISKWISIL
jgi:hypothetical protein